MLELNLKNKAAAQITLPFNSMCRFGSIFLGSTSTGLCSLGGYNDNGVEITALVRSGKLDLGMENKKRFRFFYFGVEAYGSLTMKVYGDGVLAGEYTISMVQDGHQVIRVPISRDVNAWYWEWEIENIDGAFFVLHSVAALPVILHPGHH